MDFLLNAGPFIYPLAGCSVIALFVFIERLIALRSARVVPRGMLRSFVENDGRALPEGDSSVMGRIVAFQRQRAPDAETLKAYARFEVNKMERGVFLLEIVVSAAPLIGLLGTVTGLVQVFGNFSAETGLPDPGEFAQGIGLALTTTILGLAIAIPALVAHAYLLRRVEALAARVGLGVEALIEPDGKTADAGASDTPAP